MRHLFCGYLSSGLFRTLALAGLVVIFLAGSAGLARADIDTDCSTSNAADGSTLQGSLNKAALSRLSSAIASGLKTYTDGIKGDNENQIDPPHGKFKDRECLKLVTSDYFDSIIKAIKSLNADTIMDFLFDQLDKLVDSMIQTACVWVAQQVNNLLSNVCLPLPSLGSLTFSIPSLTSASSCNGVALSSLISVASDYGTSTSGTLNLDIGGVSDRYFNMSRGTSNGQPIF